MTSAPGRWMEQKFKVMRSYTESQSGRPTSLCICDVYVIVCDYMYMYRCVQCGVVYDYI